MGRNDEHGHASRGAIARYYELRYQLRCLYQAATPDNAAIAQVLDELEATHRHFKQSASGSATAVATPRFFTTAA